MARQSVDEGQACSFTGHRPARLRMACGSDAVRALTECLYRHTLYLYYESGIRHFFSGMAQGTDIWCAQQVLRLRRYKPEVSLHCVLPCYNQEKSWSERERRVYREILSQADEVFYLNGSYFQGCMQERNRYLVDRAQTLLAVYDGAPGGGTEYTVRYAQSRDRRIILVRPQELWAPPVREEWCGTGLERSDRRKIGRQARLPIFVQGKLFCGGFGKHGGQPSEDDGGGDAGGRGRDAAAQHACQPVAGNAFSTPLARAYPKPTMGTVAPAPPNSTTES